MCSDFVKNYDYTVTSVTSTCIDTASITTPEKEYGYIAIKSSGKIIRTGYKLNLWEIMRILEGVKYRSIEMNENNKKCIMCGNKSVYNVVGTWKAGDIYGRKVYYIEKHSWCMLCGHSFYTHEQEEWNKMSLKNNHITPWQYFFKVKVRHFLNRLLYGEMAARCIDLQYWEV